MSSVYQLNKGVNRPMEFRGLRGQYLGYMAGALLITLLLFFVLFMSGVNAYVVVVLVLGLGTVSIWKVYQLNAKYGIHGLMKKRARRRVPQHLFFNSRKIFTGLCN